MDWLVEFIKGLFSLSLNVEKYVIVHLNVLQHL